VLPTGRDPNRGYHPLCNGLVTCRARAFFARAPMSGLYFFASDDDKFTPTAHLTPSPNHSSRPAAAHTDTEIPLYYQRGVGPVLLTYTTHFSPRSTGCAADGLGPSTGVSPAQGSESGQGCRIRRSILGLVRRRRRQLRRHHRIRVRNGAGVYRQCMPHDV